LGINWISGC